MNGFALAFTARRNWRRNDRNQFTMITRTLRENASAATPAFQIAVVPSTVSDEWTRRKFLTVTGGAIGLLLAFHFSGSSARAATLAAATGANGFSPNAFLRIATDGTVTVVINHSEMGQGIVTALPMLVAEELDADWTRVRTEFAPVDGAYNHAVFGIQMTGGSSSTWSEYERLRMAGATARAMLVQAAAAQWGAKLEDCHTEPGIVVHSSGKRLDYGSLADAA